MLTRSKQLYATREKRVSNVTYHGNILFEDGQEARLETMMKRFGELKTADFAQAQRDFNTTGVVGERKPRTDALQALGLPNDYARAIVESNDMVIQLAAEANERNTAKWMKELEQAKSHQQHRYRRSIEKARQLSVCLGGKKLFRDAQKKPELWSQWHDKRTFVGCSGAAGRIGGNRQIRLTSTDGVTFDLTMNIYDPETQSMNWERVGSVNFKRGNRALMDALETRASIPAKIIKKGKHYRLHVTPSVDPSVYQQRTSTGTNHAGIDLNAGHFDVTVTDPRANVLWQYTYYFKNATDELDNLVARLFEELRERSVEGVAIERLSGINRARSSRASGNTNPVGPKAPNQLPVALFKQAMVRNTRRDGILLSEINPAGTSKDTKFWPEVIFGVTTHLKASYLIARRGMGLPLRGRRAPSARGRRRMPAATESSNSDLLRMSERDDLSINDDSGTNPAADSG